MQPLKNNYSSYDATPHEGGPREIEAWALLKSANALADAKQDPSNTEGLRVALRTNLVLWTIFQAAVMEKDSPLPEDVRKNIYTLAAHVDRFTFQRFADMKVDELDFLIDMNRNIASGLYEGAAAEDAPKEDMEKGNAAQATQAPVPTHRGQPEPTPEEVRETLSLIGDLKA